MLTIFKRHTKQCRETHSVDGTPRDMGRDYRKCSCPLHTEGTLGGEMIRKALDTANWTRAQAIVREREASGKWATTEATPETTIREAVTSFLGSVCAPSAGRAHGTRRKMTATLERVNEAYTALATTRTFDTGLLEHSELEGLTRLSQLTLPVLTAWAATWKCGPKHREVRIRLLRRFFKFAVASKFTDSNPAMDMEYPKGRALKQSPKLPFDSAQLPKPGPQWLAMESYLSTRPALRALTYLMRYAGLRISDAATFNRSRICPDGSILLHMSKTSEPVTIPMHPALSAALSALTPNSSGYFFCSGEAKITTATDNWRARYSRMFAACSVEGGHPHRFRHTFAVDLLLRGMPIDQVSTLMGHYSVKITEKHYLAFVAARRAQLRDSMLAAWANTPTDTLPGAPSAPVAQQEAA